MVPGVSYLRNLYLTQVNRRVSSFTSRNFMVSDLTKSVLVCDVKYWIEICLFFASQSTSVWFDEKTMFSSLELPWLKIGHPLVCEFHCGLYLTH